MSKDEDSNTENLERENAKLKRENIELKLANSQLKQYLKEAVKQSRLQTAERNFGRAFSEPTGDNVDRDAVSELQETLREKDEQLSKTAQQLNETRKQLSEVQERLTVSRQVSIAKQRRELKQEGICEKLEKLTTDNIDENLRPEVAEDYVNAEQPPTSPTGSFNCYTLRMQLCFDPVFPALGNSLFSRIPRY